VSAKVKKIPPKRVFLCLFFKKWGIKRRRYLHFSVIYQNLTFGFVPGEKLLIAAASFIVRNAFSFDVVKVATKR